MRNVIFIIFCVMTVMVIAILTALIITIASYTKVGIVAFIIMMLFAIYLTIKYYFIDKKGILINKKSLKRNKGNI